MAYMYQAALWCNKCGEELRAKLTADGQAPEDPDDETSYDSDDFPKGPSPDDDESDSPSHCDAAEECLTALELDDGSEVGAIVSGLTEDGTVYVRSAEDSPCARAWREHYDLEPFEIELDNLDDREGCAQAVVRGPGAAKWAKEHDQCIGGSRWEAVDDTFAHAYPSDYTGLVSELEEEGYRLNLDNYSPPSADEQGR